MMKTTLVLVGTLSACLMLAPATNKPAYAGPADAAMGAVFGAALGAMVASSAARARPVYVVEQPPRRKAAKKRAPTRQANARDPFAAATPVATPAKFQ